MSHRQQIKVGGRAVTLYWSPRGFVRSSSRVPVLDGREEALALDVRARVAGDAAAWVRAMAEVEARLVRRLREIP